GPGPAAGASFRPQHGHGAGVAVRHFGPDGLAQRDVAAYAVAERAEVQDRAQRGAGPRVGELDRDLDDRAVPRRDVDALVEAALGKVDPAAIAVGSRFTQVEVVRQGGGLQREVVRVDHVELDVHQAAP